MLRRRGALSASSQTLGGAAGVVPLPTSGPEEVSDRGELLNGTSAGWLGRCT